MTSYMLLLCLAVTATGATAEPSADDTGHQRPRAPALRVREVRFAGDPGFEPDALRKVLEALRTRHLIPGIWARRPLYAAPAVDADLARLRSFYLSNGYFDAQVALASVIVAGREATLTLDVRSGPKYAVRRIRIDGLRDGDEEITVDAKSGFPADTLCTRLFAARRVAESNGRIDFAVALEVSDAAPPAPSDADRKWVDVTAWVRMGSAYAVGRIDFSGHRRIGEATLRRAIALRERSVLDLEQLRRSLARLNRSGLLEPLTLQDVTIGRNPGTATVDLTISVRERPGGRWSLSGPLGLAGGSLQATVSSRLPAWGRGVLEASTYYATFSLIGVSNPLFRLLPRPFTAAPRPLLVLERPIVPGQSLVSGFALSPQLSARGLLTNYALTHLDRAAQAVLDDPTPDSALVVPVARARAGADGSGEQGARALICSPPTPSSRWLRRGAAIASNLALSEFRPF